MTGILIVIHAIVSLMLISVILMQASQGGGLSGTFGGNAASSVLGGQNAGNVLSRITTWLATIFLSLAVVISIMSGPSENSTSSIVKQRMGAYNFVNRVNISLTTANADFLVSLDTGSQ